MTPDGDVLFLAVLCGWVAVLALLTALVRITAPGIGRLLARVLPRLVYEAAFAWTWLVLIVGRARP